jgi:hypothetical protein
VLLHLLVSTVLRGRWNLDMQLPPHYPRRILSPPSFQPYYKEPVSELSTCKMGTVLFFRQRLNRKRMVKRRAAQGLGRQLASRLRTGLGSLRGKGGASTNRSPCPPRPKRGSARLF